MKSNFVPRIQNILSQFAVTFPIQVQATFIKTYIKQ